jgi:hypothetical protein
MKRRYSLEKPKKHIIAFRLDDDEKRKMDEYCQKEKISNTDLLREKLADILLCA